MTEDEDREEGENGKEYKRNDEGKLEDEAAVSVGLAHIGNVVSQGVDSDVLFLWVWFLLLFLRMWMMSVLCLMGRIQKRNS